jgi:hypothetical protein
VQPRSAATRGKDNPWQSSADVEHDAQDRPRQSRPRAEARAARVAPEDSDDEEPPRIILRRDGTRVYVVPESRVAPAPRGYWRSW